MDLNSEENLSDEIERLSFEMDDTETGFRTVPCKRKANLMQVSDTDSASDKEINMTDASTDENRETKTLKEKQFTFLKKYFDQLRTFKPMCNWRERYGDTTTSMPQQLEDFPCECHLEKNLNSGSSKKKVKEPLAKKMNANENLDALKSQCDPFAPHNITCNLNRLNQYFLSIGRFICRDTLDKDVFLYDPDSSVDYEKKTTRLMRKTTLLMMKDGLDEFLEDWSDMMSDAETEEWKNRNKVREYLYLILKSMLESMISPSLPESSDDEAVDAPIDEEKAKYRKLKETFDDFENFINEQIRLRKLQMQRIALAGRLKVMKKRMETYQMNSYPYIMLSSDDSESESEKSQSGESESFDISYEGQDVNMENVEGD